MSWILGDILNAFAAEEHDSEVAQQNKLQRQHEENMWQKEVEEAQRQRAEDRAWYLQDDSLNYERFLENRQYNDVGNQVARLRDAGINPALALGNMSGSAGSSYQGDSMSSPSASVPSHSVTSPLAPSLQHYEGFGQGILELANYALAQRKQANEDAITNSQVAAARQKMLLDQKESIEKWIDRQYGNRESSSRRALNEVNAKLNEQLYRFNRDDRGLDIQRKRAQNMLMDAQARREEAAARADLINAASNRITALAKQSETSAMVRNLNALSTNTEFWNEVQDFCKTAIKRNQFGETLLHEDKLVLQSLLIKNGIRAADFKSEHDWTKFIDLFGSEALELIKTGASFYVGNRMAGSR